MTYPVILTEDAERDLSDLIAYVTEQDSTRSAEQLLARILDIADSLASEPARGGIPRELRDLGEQDYRQVFFKPYRLIYRVMDEKVVIYLIVDGRRDLQTLLARRLLGG